MIRSLLFKNIGLKILSLCFAIVLWYSVVSERQSNLLVTVPLTFVNVPKTMKVKKISDERVSLHLEGPLSSLRAMDVGKIRGTIDLKGAHEGKSRYELLPRHFNLPENIRVEGISPEVVYIVLERLITFKLPVKPRLRGKVDLHYVIQKVSVKPKFVWVVGDRRARLSIDNIPTEIINVNGLKKNLKKEVELDIPRDVHLEKKIEGVEFSIELREKVWDKEIDNVKVTCVKTENYLCSLYPQLIKVFVRGRATQVDVLTASEIRASIPINNRSPGTYFLSPEILLPHGIKVLSVSPRKIKVVISKN